MSATAGKLWAFCGHGAARDGSGNTGLVLGGDFSCL
jgi:hypothetical protein